MAHLDGYQNTLTGLGIVGKDKSIATTFEVDLVDSESGLLLWQGDPIAARIVETPPNEATRQGFELCIGDDDAPELYDPPAPEDQTQQLSSAAPAKKIDRVRADVRAFARRHPSAFARRVSRAIGRARRDAGDTQGKELQEAISKQLEKIEAVQAIREGLCYERVGGGGAVLIGANDYATDLRTPLDLRRVRSLDYLTPLEARELRPLYYYNDPQAPSYGKPAIYQLTAYTMGSPYDGTKFARTTEIHESRLLIFPGIRVSRRIMATSCPGWGDSVFTRVVRALRMFNVGHQSAEVLLSDFAQAIYKIKGLAEAIAKNPNALTDSMMNVELGRSICRAVVIDAEEEFERKSTTLAGYADVLDRLAKFLAGAADMPIELITGGEVQGLGNNGSSTVRFFYDRTASYQSQRVAPPLLRLVEILLAVSGEDPEGINHSIKFKPLWQPSEKEIADAHLVQAQCDQIYMTNDVVSPEEIGLSRFGGDQYSYETRIDFEARAAQQAIAAPTVSAKPEPKMIPGQDPNANPDQAKPTPEQA